MDRSEKLERKNQKAQQKINVDELIKENLELMYNIQKNRSQFCQLVGGC
jgi:hypothetical protein